MKKILFFLPGEIGGSQRMTITIANFLKDKQFDVRFVVLSNDSECPIYKILPSDFDLLKCNINIAHKSQLLKNAFKVVKIFKEEKPDFVFSSLCAINLLLLLSSFFFKTKCVIRMDNYIDIESKFSRLLIRILYPFAYKIISQQEDMTSTFLKFMPCNRNQLITIHNPIDKDMIDLKIRNVQNPYLQNNVLNYLWVANITYNKGNDILIKAFKKVHEVYSNAHLYFVGNYKNNEYCNMCFQLVKDLNLDSSITFVGFDDNPYKWMRYCDCFVLPSRIEGLPNVLVEAMYLQRPVVASECIPFIREMVDNGKNGFTCKCDNPESLADAMIKAVKLTNVAMGYKPSNADDFVKVFN